jgi:hypothetical protein
MHCVYCGVDYSLDDPCLCLPPVRTPATARLPQVEGPWGEAERDWSARPPGEASTKTVAES